MGSNPNPTLHHPHRIIILTTKFRIYNRALSAAEISAIYNATK
jgi:hypothetical protein